MKDKYIVCIDSDGCVMDTMNYKHELCFGPIAAKIWNVENEKRFLQIWNIVNLFSLTRGINRFKGLYLSFDIMSKEDKSVKALKEVEHWAKTLQNYLIQL